MAYGGGPETFSQIFYGPNDTLAQLMNKNQRKPLPYNSNIPPSQQHPTYTVNNTTKNQQIELTS